MLNCTDLSPPLPPMTPIQHAPFNRDDAERLLMSLAGIVSAHIVTDDTGALVEIHVLATAELHPKQVVRNIESALSAGMRIHVDRRIVSVAQIRAETNGSGRSRDDAQSLPVVPDPSSDPQSQASPQSHAPSPQSRDGGVDVSESEATPRLEYVRYEARRSDDRCTCEVVLRSPDREVVGTGSGPDTPEGRVAAAASAVLDAISELRPGLDLGLEGAVITTARGRQFVIVSARALQDRSTVALAGAAPLQDSPEEAAILASLQASNRWSG